MKLHTTLAPLLCATLVASKALLPRSLQQTLNPEYPVPGDNPLSFCQAPDTYPVEVFSVDLKPNPPVPGEKLYITASGTLLEQVGEGSKVHLTVKLNKFLTLINRSYDLCENLPKIDLECPLEEGRKDIEREADIPKFVPPGTYTVFAEVTDQDDKMVVCMEGSVTFHRA